jgi:hypothetical protein
MSFITTFIYPIFTYLPTILLITYCLSEMVWSHRLNTHPSWVFTKSFFLLMGTSVSYLAISMGNRNSAFHMPHILNFFFLYAVILFSILSAFYILKLLRVTWAHEFNIVQQKHNLGSLVIRLLVRTQRFILDTHFAQIIAFIALLLVLMGLLLGQIVTSMSI